ncbi:hypothetical protein Tco_1152535 [Tanacetum coccineum]
MLHYWTTYSFPSPNNIHCLFSKLSSIDFSLVTLGVVSTFLFLVFEEVLRLLLVGSLSSSEADSDGGVIGLAIYLPCVFLLLLEICGVKLLSCEYDLVSMLLLLSTSAIGSTRESSVAGTTGVVTIIRVVVLFQDEDPRLQSRFWRSSSIALGTTNLVDEHCFTIPEMDGQSMINTDIKGLVRACMIDFGSGWDKHYLWRNSHTIIMPNSRGPEMIHEMAEMIVQKKLCGLVGDVRWNNGITPQELQGIHNTFHVSNLKKCLSDEDLIIPLDEVRIDEKLHFIEEPIEIMDREVKQLKQSRIPIVKVRWNSSRGPEYTWEREDQMWKKYPHLFDFNKKRATR